MGIPPSHQVNAGVVLAVKLLLSLRGKNTSAADIAEVEASMRSMHWWEGTQLRLLRLQRMYAGVPSTVLVERSSYESHPLGRLEWIRLYGLHFQ